MKLHKTETVLIGITFGIIFILSFISFVNASGLFPNENNYDALIEKYSKENNLDFYFVKALIAQESGFNPNSGSNVGAKGLMQLMPKTFKAVCKNSKINCNKGILDPETNIRVGTAYLADVLKRFEKAFIFFGPKRHMEVGKLALAGYNGGYSPDAALQTWLKEKRYYMGNPDGTLGRDSKAAMKLANIANTMPTYDNVLKIMKNPKWFWVSKVNGTLIKRKPDHKQIEDYVSKIMNYYSRYSGRSYFAGAYRSSDSLNYRYSFILDDFILDDSRTQCLQSYALEDLVLKIKYYAVNDVEEGDSVCPIKLIDLHDPNLGDSSFAYDSLGMLLKESYFYEPFFDASYDYYSNGRLRSISNSGGTVYFIYDGLGRVKEEITKYKEGKATSLIYEYNSKGELIKTYAPGKTTTFSYNDAGLLTREEYDIALGEIQSKIYGEDSVNEWMEHEYDNDGNLICERDNTGYEICYEYTTEESFCLGSNLELITCPYQKLVRTCTGNFCEDIVYDEDEDFSHYVSEYVGGFTEGEQQIYTPLEVYDENFVIETDWAEFNYDPETLLLSSIDYKFNDPDFSDTSFLSEFEYHPDFTLAYMENDDFYESYDYNPLGEPISVTFTKDSSTKEALTTSPGFFALVASLITGMVTGNSFDQEITYYFTSPGDADTIHTYSDYTQLINEFEAEHGNIPEIPYYHSCVVESSSNENSYVRYDGDIYFNECIDENNLSMYDCGIDIFRWDFWNINEKIVKKTEVNCELGCFNGACIESEQVCDGTATDPDCWSSEATGLAWGPMGVVTNTQSLTDGKTNTVVLAGLAGDYPAADYCYNLVENGYDDWYLPAHDELWTGWEIFGVEGFPSGDYWSSTENTQDCPNCPNDYAWELQVGTLVMGNDEKDTEWSVRCLRGIVGNGESDLPEEPKAPSSIES